MSGGSEDILYDIVANLNTIHFSHWLFNNLPIAFGNDLLRFAFAPGKPLYERVSSGLVPITRPFATT